MPVDHSQYKFGCPEGQWTGKLDDKEWGKSLNLKLYFTDVGTGEHHWFSVFHAEGYRPRKGGPSFKGEEPGGYYQLATKLNRNGNPVLESAEKGSPFGARPTRAPGNDFTS